MDGDTHITSRTIILERCVLLHVSVSYGLCTMLVDCSSTRKQLHSFFMNIVYIDIQYYGIIGKVHIRIYEKRVPDSTLLPGYTYYALCTALHTAKTRDDVHVR